VEVQKTKGVIFCHAIHGDKQAFVNQSKLIDLQS
jgi:hypothetical protein